VGELSQQFLGFAAHHLVAVEQALDEQQHGGAPVSVVGDPPGGVQCLRADLGAALPGELA